VYIRTKIEMTEKVTLGSQPKSFVINHLPSASRRTLMQKNCQKCGLLSIC